MDTSGAKKWVSLDAPNGALPAILPLPLSRWRSAGGQLRHDDALLCAALLWSGLLFHALVWGWVLGRLHVDLSFPLLQVRRGAHMALATLR